MEGPTLNYDDVGSGQPILLIHGFPHDRCLWRAQLDALSTTARVIVPDLRGFGDSSEPSRAMSMDDHAEDLHDLLEDREVGERDDAEQEERRHHAREQEPVGGQKVDRAIDGEDRQELLVDGDCRAVADPRLDQHPQPDRGRGREPEPDQGRGGEQGAEEGAHQTVIRR